MNVSITVHTYIMASISTKLNEPIMDNQNGEENLEQQNLSIQTNEQSIKSESPDSIIENELNHTTVVDHDKTCQDLLP
ncbi:hypothetical protein BLA29_012244, partial [Euroglyphus maynei]